MKMTAHTMTLAGTSYEIGQIQGELAKSIPALAAALTAGMPGFGKAETDAARAMFERWCPGLNEELEGFADALGASPEQVTFYGMTHLRPRPRCSQLAVLPDRTACGQPLLARNYEFNHQAEDFCLRKTSVAGRYTHLGTSVLNFGREDGFNEHGLAVTMSTSGFPVGPLDNMRPPALIGLQFWAVIRALLENCRNVDEALAYMDGMPIAFNLNLMLVDKGGQIALVETLDGRFAAKRIGPGSDEGWLLATNHPVLPEIIPFEPRAMRHSLLRYDWAAKQMADAREVTVDALKAMLLARFPEGLCCHAYEDFFGTTKSMVIDPAAGAIDICWGGLAENGWNRYEIGAPLPESHTEITLEMERFAPAMGEFLPLAAPSESHG